MKPRWLIFTVLAAVILAGCYDMRSQFYNKSKSESESSTNDTALAEEPTGTNAIAGLIKQLGGSGELDSVTKKLVKIGMPAVPALVKVLKEGGKDQRSDAVYVLVRMNSLPADVYNAVEQVLDKPDTDAIRVAMEIQKFYPDSDKAASVLIHGLKNGEPSTRIVIARMLSLIPSEKYVPALLEALSENEKEDRLAVLQTLSDIILKYPSSGRQMVPALTKALDSPFSRVQCQAAKCLGMIGEPARSAIPALEKKRGDSNLEVGQAAAAAVERINSVKTQKPAGKKPSRDFLK